jgi:hypothetical protein
MSHVCRYLAVACLFLAGCSQQKKDSDIKADITTKAKTEIAFAGVNYMVENGMVHLYGSCPSPREKDKVITTVKKIAGVKEIADSMVIQPVMLTADFSLKQSVDSVLKRYSLATAVVSNGTVLLQGKATGKDHQKITEALHQLPVSGIDNRMLLEPGK